MEEQIKQMVYFNMYTICATCKGEGSHSLNFGKSVCAVCRGKGKNEKLISVEELKKLLNSTDL